MLYFISLGSIGHGNWTYFSATCWFFGQNLYDSLKYPIGLVATDYGGTPVEAWSSPDALKKCVNKEKYVYSYSAEMYRILL